MLDIEYGFTRTLKGVSHEAARTASKRRSKKKVLAYSRRSMRQICRT